MSRTMKRAKKMVGPFSFRPCGTFPSLLGLILGLTACGSDSGREPEVRPKPPATTRKSVYTVNYPLQYFAQRIAGDHLRVEFPGDSGVDPSVWNPEPETIQHYQNADLVLLNGTDYAGWISRATLRRSRLVNTAAAFQDRWIPEKDAVTHSHGNEGEHTHSGFASTTWLDPILAIGHAEAIRNAFEQLEPENAESFRANFVSLRKDLEDLDRQMKTSFAVFGDTPWLASHPVYQYLARRYHLDLYSLHWEPGEVPEESDWSKLQKILNDHPAPRMLWEDTPLPEIARRLKTLDLHPIVFKPCGGMPATGDYLDVMHANLRNLSK